MHSIATEYDAEHLFFGALVRGYVKDNKRFLRRSWLADAVSQQLRHEHCRFVLLTAEPGAGKTTFMAQLADDNPAWLRYFIRRDQRSTWDGVSARHLLRSIGFQFAALCPNLFSEERLRLYVEQCVGEVADGAEVIGAKIQRLFASPFCRGLLEIRQHVRENRGMVVGLRIDEFVSGRMLEPEDLLQLALIEPARALQRMHPTRQVVVLIDALDEIRYHHTEHNILSWLANCPSPQLPSNVRIIVSSRRDDGALRLFREKQQRYLAELDLHDDSRLNSDARTYIARLVKEDAVEAALSSSTGVQPFVEKVSEKSHGNLGYIDAIARGIDHALSLGCAGAISSLPSLDALPTDLQDLYKFFLSQIEGRTKFEQIEFWDPTANEVRWANSWLAAFRPILGVLSVAVQPLTPDLIRRLSGVQIDLASVLHVLDGLSQFLNKENGRYRLYHTSLAEFLTDPRTAENPETAFLFFDAKEWHNRISAYFWRQRDAWSKCDPYGLDSLAFHLAASDQVDRLMALFDASWMRARHEQRRGSYHGFLGDLAVARTHLDDRNLLTLQRRIRLTTMAQLTTSIVDDFDDDDLEVLVLLGREHEAIAHAHLRASARLRLLGIVRIYRALLEEGRGDASILHRAAQLEGTVGDPTWRAECLLELVEAYISVGLELANNLFEKLERSIGDIDDPQRRWYALNAAIRGLAKSGAYDKAERLLSTLQSDVRVTASNERGKYLDGSSVVAGAETSLVTSLLNVGLLERAKRLVPRIEDEVTRASAWAALSIAYSNEARETAIDFANRAAEIADNHPYGRDKTLGSAGVALLRCDSQRGVDTVYRALAIARKSVEVADRVIALSRLARTCHPGDSRLACAIFEEAINVASHDGFEPGSDGAFNTIASDLLSVGESRLALKCAALVQSHEARTELFAKLALGLFGDAECRQRALDEGFVAFRLIEPASRPVGIARSLALALARSKDPRAAAVFQTARELANSPKPGDFDWALAQWAPIFARSGHVESAKRIIRLIKIPLACQEALYRSLEAVGMRDFEALKALADELQNDINAVVVLINLARYAAQWSAQDAPGLLERAEVVARRLTKSASRAEALGYIARAENELSPAKADRLFEDAYREAASETNQAILSDSLEKTALALAISRRHERARMLIEKLGSKGDHNRREIVDHLARLKRFREARSYLCDMAVSDSSFFASEREWALAGVITILGKAGRFGIAKKLAASVRHPDPKARTLLELGDAIRSIDPQQAERLFRGSQKAALASEDPQMLAYICVDLVRIGAMNAPAMLDDTIKKIGSREGDTLLKLVKQLSELGKADEAVAVAQAIEQTEQREIARAYLVRALSTVGRFEEALSELEFVETSQLRDFALGSLAVSYAKMEKYDEADNTIMLITDPGTEVLVIHQLESVASQKQPDRAATWLAKMGELLSKVDDEKVIVELASCLASETRYAAAIAALSPCKLDTYLRMLGEMFLYYEGNADAPTTTLLCEAAEIAGWARQDWREVRAVLG